jgi:type IV secretion system protein VirB11
VRSPDPTHVAAPSSLDHYSRQLVALLADPSVTELCLQRPGELHIERASGWARVAASWATLAWARSFARLVATATEQRVNPGSPLLSATLPGGERVQVVLPPATTPDQIALAIRRPSQQTWSLEELATGGLFEACRPAGTGVTTDGPALARHFGGGDWRSFLALAVRARLNILVSGATGSGKTTLTKALIREIPVHERLISIEDAAELEFTRHWNVVRLFYSKDGQGVARVTPKQLLEASLRLRPDRILLAELRGEEAYYFLRNVSSGHPGSITSIHAGSCALAFEQIALLVKESAPGREMPLIDIHRLLRQVVDVVVQCGRDAGARRVQEVWWRDAPRPVTAP